MLSWLSVWSEVQMICIWSRWCHCHPIICCFINIQIGLPFWCWLTEVVLQKTPLNGSLSITITVRILITYLIMQQVCFQLCYVLAWHKLCWFQETPHSASVNCSDVQQRNRNCIKAGYCVKQGAVVSIVSHVSFTHGASLSPVSLLALCCFVPHAYFTTGLGSLFSAGRCSTGFCY